MEGINKFILLVVILVLSALGYKIYDDYTKSSVTQKAVEYSKSETTIESLEQKLDSASQSTKHILQRTEQSEKLQKENELTSDPSVHDKNFFKRL